MKVRCETRRKRREVTCLRAQLVTLEVLRRREVRPWAPRAGLQALYKHALNSYAVEAQA